LRATNHVFIDFDLPDSLMAGIQEQGFRYLHANSGNRCWQAHSRAQDCELAGLRQARARPLLFLISNHHPVIEKHRRQRSASWRRPRAADLSRLREKLVMQIANDAVGLTKHCRLT